MSTIILRLPDVLRRTGLSRSSLYDLMSRGLFPRQVALGRRSVGWRAEEVDRWIDSRRPPAGG